MRPRGFRLNKAGWQSELDYAEVGELIEAVFGPANPNGQKLLAHFERIFQGSMFVSGNTERTMYNIGQYELVQYIKHKLKSRGVSNG